MLVTVAVAASMQVQPQRVVVIAVMVTVVYSCHESDWQGPDREMGMIIYAYPYTYIIHREILSTTPIHFTIRSRI